MSNLQDIIRTMQGKDQSIDFFGFLFCIGMSLLFTVIILVMYQKFFANRNTGVGVDRSFLLIGPSVTALLLAIQFSLPLSLGLLGSLSFVRFRAPIKQPEEIGYILLLVASSIGCATFNYTLVAILVFIVAFAFILKNLGYIFLKKNYQKGLIVVFLTESNYQTFGEKADNFIREHFQTAKLENLSIADGMVSLFYRFKEKKWEHLGVLAKNLKEVAMADKVNVFLEGVYV